MSRVGSGDVARRKCPLSVTRPAPPPRGDGDRAARRTAARRRRTAGRPVVAAPAPRWLRSGCAAVASSYGGGGRLLDTRPTPTSTSTRNRPSWKTGWPGRDQQANTRGLGEGAGSPASNTEDRPRMVVVRAQRLGADGRSDHYHETPRRAIRATRHRRPRPTYGPAVPPPRRAAIGARSSSDPGRLVHVRVAGRRRGRPHRHLGGRPTQVPTSR